jgi:hypothetical protein
MLEIFSCFLYVSVESPWRPLRGLDNISKKREIVPIYREMVHPHQVSANTFYREHCVQFHPQGFILARKSFLHFFINKEERKMNEEKSIRYLLHHKNCFQAEMNIFQKKLFIFKEKWFLLFFIGKEKWYTNEEKSIGFFSSKGVVSSRHGEI